MSFTRLAIELTQRCNLDCKHCLRDLSDTPLDFSVDLLERILDQTVSGYGVDAVTFTGGEPLLHPEFERVLETVAGRGLSFSIVTNGHLVPKRIGLFRRPGIREAIGNLAVSFEGMNAEVYDSIRGKGGFRKAMAAVAAIKASALPLAIKYSIGAHNYRSLEPDTLAMAHLNPSFINFTHLTPTPDNYRAGLLLSPVERRAVEETVNRLIQEFKIPLTMSADVYCGRKFFICASLSMSELYIDVRGRLGFCCVVPGLRGGEEEGDEIVADLAKVDFFDAHKQLIEVINAFQRDRIEKLRAGGLDGIDSFQCEACARYFNKLNWLDEADGGSRLMSMEGGGD